MKQKLHPLCVALLALVLCNTPLFAHDFSDDGIYYHITSDTDKTVAVTYRGDTYSRYDNEYSGAVTIPESVTYSGSTYSVTSIGDWAFFGCDNLTSVEIPNSVTSIGENAFSNCRRLTSVVIPNSVTSIGIRAFFVCYGLTSVVIGNSVTSIGDWAFWNCSNLTSVEIGNSVTSIGDYAFQDCKSLTSVVIPNSVTSIGDDAFYRCSLTSVVIPNSVTSIWGRAFGYCSRLTSVVIGNSVTSIGEGAFHVCSNLTSVEIGNSVTSIGDDAFFGCSSLTSVVIPNSVTSIGENAFSNCTSLTSVEIPNSVTSIGYHAFSGCSRLTTATVGCSWKTKPLYNFGSGVTVNATLHNYENGICTVCGDKEFPTITYIVDGVVYATIQQKAGETPKLPEPPTKEGYTFKRWKNLPEVMPGEDITVEAEFTINTYEITYVIDDAVFAKQSVTYGEKITPPDAPEKEGYGFSGWENLPTTMPAHDVTVKGLYEVNTYVLRIYLNGVLYQTMAVDYGTVLNIPVPTVPEDMEFKGWTTEIPATMPAHDLDIYGTYDYPTSIAALQTNQRVTIYTLNGLLICKDAQWQTVKDKLSSGLYIVNGKKTFVKTEQ